MKPGTRRWLRALGPLALYAAAIFALSAQSDFAVSLPRFPHADKLVHVIEYAGFGFLTARAIAILRNPPAWRLAALAIVLGACYGATDELHQFFVPDRDASGWDLVADVIGCALGTFAFLAIAARRAARRPTPARETA